MSCDGLGHVDLPDLDPAFADREPGTTPVPAPGATPVPTPVPDPGSGPVPTPVPDPGSGPVPGSPGTGVELVTLPPRLPLTRVAWLWVRRQLPAIPGSFRTISRKVKTHQPKTLQDHGEYIGARGWVRWAAEGRYGYLEGWLRTFIVRTAKWGGVIYGHTLGKGFILAGMWLQEMGHRQSKFWQTMLALAVLVVAWKLQHILFG